MGGLTSFGLQSGESLAYVPQQCSDVLHRRARSDRLARAVSLSDLCAQRNPVTVHVGRVCVCGGGGAVWVGGGGRLCQVKQFWPGLKENIVASLSKVGFCGAPQD
jgi:hypothetical protein